MRPECPRCGTTTSELYPIMPPHQKASATRRLLSNLALNGVVHPEALPARRTDSDSSPSTDSDSSDEGTSSNSADIVLAYSPAVL